MDTSLTVILSLFLLTYAVKVGTYCLNTFYDIAQDLADREKAALEAAKEEEEKNKIPESVKHLYS